MSEENVDVVRRFVRGLDPDLSIIGELCDPEVDHRAIEGAPDDVGVLIGQDALRSYFAQWFETFEDLQAEPEEIDDEGDRVVIGMHVTGCMKGSEAPIDMRLGVVYTLREGKIVRGREYATLDEARARADSTA